MTYMLTFSVRKCLVLNQNLNLLNILSMLKNALFEFYNLLNISGFLIHYRGILQHLYRIIFAYGFDF